MFREPWWIKGREHQNLVAIATTAAMRSALPLPPTAPSSALLRFLKSQSESVCFFSANPQAATFTFDHAAPRGSHLHSRSARALPKARDPSSTAEPPRILEAGFVNLDFLFPRSAACIRNHESRPFRMTSRSSILRCASLFGGHRSASTRATQKWHQKLWGSRGGKPLQPDDLPTTMYGSEETGDTSMFSLGRHISAKAAAQPKLRCTELDENGNVSMASGEFKKSELIAKVCKLIKKNYL
jgi:magnesium transporter